MYTSKLKIKTSPVNVWRSLCWWPGLSYCLVTSSISQGRPQKKPATVERKKESKVKKRNETEMWQVTYFPRPPTLRYPHQSCRAGLGPGRSQQCQVSSKSVKRFGLPDWSQSAIFLRLALWLITSDGREAKQRSKEPRWSCTAQCPECASTWVSVRRSHPSEVMWYSMMTILVVVVVAAAAVARSWLASPPQPSSSTDVAGSVRSCTASSGRAPAFVVLDARSLPVTHEIPVITSLQ